MYFYAQITGGFCTAVTQTAGPLVGSQFVQLTFLDTTRLGQAYSNGAWQ